ncbi:hypothetical protein DPMN_017034, partial [Dreissena polymorpha]
VCYSRWCLVLNEVVDTTKDFSSGMSTTNQSRMLSEWIFSLGCLGENHVYQPLRTDD